MCTLLGLSHADIFYENLRNKVSDRIGNVQLEAIEELGLLDDVEVVKMNTPLDSLSHFLSKNLALGKHNNIFNGIETFV